MDFALTDSEKKQLLAFSRAVIAAALNEGKPEPSLAATGSLAAKAGAFVSLHLGGRLRGCIGRMRSDEALVSTVREMAKAAAFEDPRFEPLSAEELARAKIEISVLSPIQRAKSPDEVEVGRHGLYLIESGRSGVLLPQVPVEYGWDRETFLEQICYKAGLPPKAWKKPDAELYLFEGIVFGE